MLVRLPASDSQGRKGGNGGAVGGVASNRSGVGSIFHRAAASYTKFAAVG